MKNKKKLFNAKDNFEIERGFFEQFHEIKDFYNHHTFTVAPSSNKANFFFDILSHFEDSQ